MLAKILTITDDYGEEIVREVPLPKRLGKYFEFFCLRCGKKSGFDFTGEREYDTYNKLFNTTLFVECPYCHRLHSADFFTSHELIPKMCPYKTSTSSISTHYRGKPSLYLSESSDKVKTFVSSSFERCIGSMCSSFDDGRCSFNK